ncbi:MAG TPA: carbohydrate-binding protein [Polyangiaceae bacterium]|nr:carbohydrate-binding protein [Polyangiaceae bacterium]
MAGCDEASDVTLPSSSSSSVGQLALALGIVDDVIADEHDHDDPPPGGDHEHDDPPGGPVYVPMSGSESGDAGADDAGPAPGAPPPAPPLLDPATIPKFAHELLIPPVLVPTRRSRAANDGDTPGGATSGDPARGVELQYALSVRQTRVQMLPPPLPQTTVLAYGGNVRHRGSTRVDFEYVVPGPTIEAVRGVPHELRVDNAIDTPHFLAVDPTLHWANPNHIEPPISPFVPFPPGYPEAQFPVAHVTHTHGLMVESEMDGVARQWTTVLGQLGPHFLTRTYRQPNDQPPTQLWYHDHALGMTRLNVYSGLAGNYIIHDPNDPLEAPRDSVAPALPTGDYEIPLVIADRGFLADGELDFPRVGINPDNPYWSVAVPATTNIVNGRVWPNLNVERRAYRFRVLIAPNARVYNLGFDNAMPFTIIGSDGGFLPRPVTASSLTLGVTERADLVVDFSGVEPGTAIVLQDVGNPSPELGTIMRFTVQDGEPVAPAPLPATLHDVPRLVQTGRTRTKVQNAVVDARGNLSVFLDGLTHAQRPIDYPLVGSTERWDLVQNSAITHFIHLHLIEFQVVDRQPIDSTAYNARWLLMNGQAPLPSRPIVVDPTAFFTGPATPAADYESGWKDTVRAPGNAVTRILARWAPQELPIGDGGPGVNSFSIDPTTGPGYLWHCHILAHEDHDMMRDLQLINAWQPARRYETDTVVQYQGVDYRALSNHASQAETPPSDNVERWERVNDDDGGWAPQIQYVVNDRVLYQGRLFLARAAHQSLPGQPPPSLPAIWQELPQTFCGQITTFCGGIEEDAAAACNATGLQGDEMACQGSFAQCLAQCAPSDLSGAGHQHEDYASYCGQLASACHGDTTELGVECHDLGHAGDEAACEARQLECLGRCTPSRSTRANFTPAPLSPRGQRSP